MVSQKTRQNIPRSGEGSEILYESVATDHFVLDRRAHSAAKPLRPVTPVFA